MVPTEIIPNEEDRQHRVVVGPFLGKGVCQSRHPADVHSDIEVLTLGVRRADLFHIRVAEHPSLADASYFGRGVASLPYVRPAGVYLDQLGKVNPAAQNLGNGRAMRLESGGR